MKEKSFKYVIYKITNLKNQKIYIGAHKVEVLENGNLSRDSYYGSSELLTKDIRSLGKSSFKKEILETFDCPFEAGERESEIVDSAFVDRSDTYNVRKASGYLANFLKPKKVKEKKVKEKKVYLDKEFIDSKEVRKNLSDSHLSKSLETKPVLNREIEVIIESTEEVWFKGKLKDFLLTQYPTDSAFNNGLRNVLNVLEKPDGKRIRRGKKKEYIEKVNHLNKSKNSLTTLNLIVERHIINWL